MKITDLYSPKYIPVSLDNFIQKIVIRNNFFETGWKITMKFGVTTQENEKKNNFHN